MVRNRATTPLKVTKIRMSMSTFNLYNLSRLTLPAYKTRTFFQQKWKAKSLLRQYHGEQVREGQWTRMFSRRLRSVVPMDPAYLAENDGSAESAGRGRGLEMLEERAKKGTRMARNTKKEVELTPFMNMTFAPLERRLDVAVFRALFASSARQARQFVVHGDVKVNGQVMRFPGYLLNPGDMFQVEPERVMLAMGRRKGDKSKEVIPVARRRRVRGTRTSSRPQKPPKKIKCKRCKQEGHKTLDCPLRGKSTERYPPPDPAQQEIDESQATKELLKSLQSQAKGILSSPREDLGAKQKQSLREFSQTVRKMMSRAGKGSVLTDSLEAQFEELKQRLKIQKQAKEQGKSLGPSQQEGAAPQSPSVSSTINYVSEVEHNELFRALRQVNDEERLNPLLDPRKPYLVPWQPRKYMSAFAFIPRYLEVNQNACAAVYLRHPVARPGLAEVPTPYPEGVNGSAFAWYLRRR